MPSLIPLPSLLTPLQLGANPSSAMSHSQRARSAPAQDRRAGVACLRAELLFDAQELVVLGQAIRARQRAGLDLPAVGGDGEIGDGRILGLARAMGHHRAV